MGTLLLYTAVFFALVKVAATIWYVRQPDAATVTATPRGRALYYAGKFSPALFVATLLARASVQGAAATRIALWSGLLVVAVAMAVVAVRQRAAGTSYGLVHDVKRRRREGRES